MEYLLIYQAVVSAVSFFKVKNWGEKGNNGPSIYKRMTFEILFILWKRAVFWCNSLKQSDIALTVIEIYRNGPSAVPFSDTFTILLHHFCPWEMKSRALNQAAISSNICKSKCSFRTNVLYLLLCIVDRKVIPFYIMARPYTSIEWLVYVRMYVCNCKSTHPGTGSTQVILRLRSETDGESETLPPPCASA